MQRAGAAHADPHHPTGALNGCCALLCLPKRIGHPPACPSRFLPAQRGTYSAAFLHQLTDDCPECPWWDEERPLKVGLIKSPVWWLVVEGT